MPVALLLIFTASCIQKTSLGDMTDDVTDMELQLGINITGPGMYLGAYCELSCNRDLLHVFCDQDTSRCQCEPHYPVKLGFLKGCAKPVKLGDQCFYYETCVFTDENSECIQVRHNAKCQCKQGYHEVTLSRPQKRVFCSQDILLVTTNTSTLLVIASGLAIISALICFVLKLFVGDQPRHYANANIAPPMLFASEAGIPLTMHPIRPSSRASSERSEVSFNQRGTRGGVIVPASRVGAARAAAILLISCQLTPQQLQHQSGNDSHQLSMTSVHSSSSSRSYSTRRFEREKEQRQARERARANTASPRSTDLLMSDQTIDRMESRLTCIVETPRRNTEVKFYTPIGSLSRHKRTLEHTENLISVFLLDVSTIQELTEWPDKGSDNTLDVSEEGTVSDTEVTLFPPLSSSLPADYGPLSLPNSEWPRENL